MALHSPPIVGVMGSGRDSYNLLAAEVAGVLVELGASLLTGGGGGVMRSVAEAYVNHPDRKVGASIGIIPCMPGEPTRPKPGYPNEFVEIAIYTHLFASAERGEEVGSRNHINILTPEFIIALPGRGGTASEVRLAQIYQKPVVAYSRHPEETSAFPPGVRRVAKREELLSMIKLTLAKN